MRKLFLILALLLLAGPAFGQFYSPDVIYVSVAPSGSCAAGSRIQQLVVGTGATYSCQNISGGTGTWTSVGGGGSGTVTVVGAGSLTSTAFVTGGGSQTLQTPSATSTLSSGGNASFAGTVAATSALIGSPSTAAQAAIPSGAHGWAFDETSTAGVPAASVDYCRADSTSHKFQCSVNNASESGMALLGTAQTFTAVQTISASNGFVLSAMTGTSCLEEVSGVVTSTGSACGGGSSPTPSSNAYFADDFNCSPINGIGGTVGCLNWKVLGTSPTTAVYTSSGTGNYWGAETCTTSASSANFCNLSAAQFSFPFYTTFTAGTYSARVLLGATTNNNFAFGIYDANSNYGESSTSFAGIAYSNSAGDTGWMCVTKKSGTGTRTAISGTLNATAFHTLTVTWTAGSTIQCQVDGGTATSMATTNFPTSANMTPGISVDNNGTANAEAFTVDYIYHNLTGLSR